MKRSARITRVTPGEIDRIFRTPLAVTLLRCGHCQQPLTHPRCTDFRYSHRRMRNRGTTVPIPRVAYEDAVLREIWQRWHRTTP